MIPYYCNDAILQLPNVYSLVDLTRQFLEIVTVEDTELQLVIERARMAPDMSLQAAVDASIAERKRSQRGFELVSLSEREYPAVTGVEACVTFVDRERGPRFLHEFHCVVAETRVAYLCTSRLAHAPVCEQWMHTMLEHLTLQ